MLSPRLVKGGLVEVDAGSGAVRRVVMLQYNPDSMARTLKLSGTDGGPEALRIGKPPTETLRIEVELDATDAMEKGAGAELGVHPMLAALEQLVHPSLGELRRRDALASAGAIEIISAQGPLTLFVWSAKRILPVQLSELAVTEEAFDARLNPVRAKVTVGMRVLTAGDLGYDQRGGGIYLTYLGTKASLSRKVSDAALASLGIGAIP
ncbi:hypothetical protein [Blastococcus saxobsidens]|uniref:Uncharacterized protein n=1 Tax=Blastococcus saxobsidens (strain DD2) TaxID=1146883 RepID=H6RPH4_BLASD|nr:hypothetical protein [Blastococcus saxobsidens]CCG04033.1 conserved protein of unknown function; putative signal peptide; putative GTPase domain [Blastococcus saxobsidens DD2]